MNWFNRRKKTQPEPLEIPGFTPSDNSIEDLRFYLKHFLGQKEYVKEIVAFGDHIEVKGSMNDITFTALIGTRKRSKTYVTTSGISIQLLNKEYDEIICKAIPKAVSPLAFFIFELAELEKYGLGQARRQVWFDLEVMDPSEVPMLAGQIMKIWTKHVDMLLTRFSEPENIIRYLESGKYKLKMMGCSFLRHTAQVHCAYAILLKQNWEPILEQYKKHLDKADPDDYPYLLEAFGRLNV